MSKQVRRLFSQFQPEHYELALTLNRDDMTFEGSVTIVGRKTGRPANRLTFHQKALSITNAHILRHDKKADEMIDINRINYHRRFDEVRLHTDKMLYPGRYTISLTFQGKTTRAMQGIYPCFFKHQGKEEALLATQFESHHAREAFPCIDEPEAKATFDLILTSAKGETVLSNTPIKSQLSKGSSVITTFETTPKMSVYLLAFVCGPLHYVEHRSKSGVTVRSYATIAQPLPHLEYATQEAANILDFFTDYFDTPYPLKKLDQVALPDFDATAMENWGLITYREMALLSDPANSSISNEQFITLVIAHELSHQWFGNLVTMKWWNDLWLNESFAGLMEHTAPASLHPDWQQWELYAMSDIPLITSRDVYKNIQPVGMELADPALIETLFDPAIVYAKGARLLKMLREYIGEPVFKKGLTDYFKTHAYKNADRNDLWKVLGKASGKDIQAFLTPWLIQSGMPVVHVAQKSKELELNQERFVLDGKPDDSLWPIPLLANVPVQPDSFQTKMAKIQLSTNGYVLLNQHGSGQYLTHYQVPEHREELAKSLGAGQLTTEARINLLNDTYMLARHGDISLTDALDMVNACTNEPRDSVWAMLGRILGSAGQLTEGSSECEQLLKTVKVTLTSNWYKKLGWEDKPTDDPNTKQLRHSMIALMIAGEDPEAIKKSLQLYAKVTDLQTLPAELRNTILATAVRHGDSKVVPKLLKAYEAASPEVQQDISSALAATKDPKVAQKVLDTALGKAGFVRSQDVMRWLALFLRNYHIRSVAWQFMIKHWQWLEETLTESKAFDYLPTYCAAIVSTPEWERKYHQFFEPKLSNKMLNRNIKLGMADAAARVAWRKRDENAITNWLHTAAN